MKKILTLLLAMFAISEVSALTFDEAIEQSDKIPAAVLIYADWADDIQEAKQSFSLMEQRYKGKYNFLKLNIADKDTKSFNKTYSIMPNLPYVMLFRNGIKFSRMVYKDCVKDDSCLSDKLEVFDNR